MTEAPGDPHARAEPTPVTLPHLSLPTGRRRYFGLGLSLALHAALLALIIFQGDRLWRRDPGGRAAALFLFQGRRRRWRRQPRGIYYPAFVARA